MKAIEMIEKAKNAKKKIGLFLASNWILLWLIVSCLGFATIVTYAAYTHYNYTKRVVTINGGGGLQFSSNNLYAVAISETPDTDNRPRYVYYTENTTPEIAFTVCNFPQSSASLINPQSITYTLTAEIYGKTDSTKVSRKEDLETLIEDLGDASCYIEYGGTKYELINEDTLGCEISDLELTAAESTTHSFILHIDNKLAENVDVFVTAKPNEESQTAAGDQMLCRKFVFNQSVTQSTSWVGEFTDTIVDGAYYGYNYRINGTAQETRVLTWDASKLELSQLSLSKLEKEENDIKIDEDHIARLTLELGSASDETEEIVTSYDLQFYRTSENSSTAYPDSSWVSLAYPSDDTSTETSDSSATSLTE